MSHSPALNIMNAKPPMASIPAFGSVSATAGVQMKTHTALAAMNAAKAPTYLRNVMNGVYSPNV